MLGACGSGGAAPPTTTVARTSTTLVDPLDGFAVVQVLVSGDPWSVALADTPALRAQGLMGVTDLGDLDGMLFLWDEDVLSGFWMRDTLIPLDVAFFTAAGVLVDLLRMEPCTADPCPVYHPRGPYRYALETEVGQWDAIDQPALLVPDL